MPQPDFRLWLPNGSEHNFGVLRDRSHLDTALGPDIAAFLAWRKIARKAPRTLDANERTLAVGALMYPHLGFEDWTGREMEAVAAAMPDKSRRHRVSCWRKFWYWGIVHKRRTDNPCDQLPEIKRTPLPVVRTFTETEILRLTTLPDAVDRPLTRLLLDTGIRMEEARKLRVRDYLVEPAPGFVHVRGKGSKDRLIPCTRAVAQGLNELILTEGLQVGGGGRPFLVLAQGQSEHDDGAPTRRADRRHDVR